MGPGNRERRLPIVVASIVTAVVVLTATATLVTAVVVLPSFDEPVFVGAGVLAGVALGSIKRGYVFDTALAVTGIGIGAWSLSLVGSGLTQDSGLIDDIVPLAVTALLAFLASLAVSRSWRRAARLASAPIDIDDMVAEQGVGVRDEP